ncbi:MAG: flippase-like domain-containing protein [bacterium]|nr:flippase-like domain-containing protein [bacterium]
MKRKLGMAAALLVGVALVWLLFKDMDWAEFWQAIRGAHVGWLLLAQVPVWMSFFVRIQRWSYVVRATDPDVSFRSMFSATQVAFLANFTIGMRSGEFVRPLLLSRLSKVSFSKAFAMNTLDRVNDLIGMVVVILVASAAFHPKGDLTLPAGVLGNADAITLPGNFIRSGAVGTLVSMSGIVAVLVMLYINKQLALRLADGILGRISTRLSHWACGLLEQFAEGLHVFRSIGDMAKSIFFSLVTWGTFLVSAAFIFEAFDLDYPWYTVFVMQSLLALAVSIPGPPGMMGQFHLPFILALVVVAGTPAETARAVAVVAHLLNLLPVVLAGGYCLFRENVSLVALTRESEELEERLHHEGAEDVSSGDV